MSAAEPRRPLRDGLRLEHALGADAQRIEIPATHVAHHEKAQHLVEVARPRVDEMVRDGAERARALLELARRIGIDAAGIDRERDDRPPIGLGEPRNAEGGVETSGECKQDGPGARR